MNVNEETPMEISAGDKRSIVAFARALVRRVPASWRLHSLAVSPHSWFGNGQVARGWLHIRFETDSGYSGIVERVSNLASGGIIEHWFDRLCVGHGGQFRNGRGR